MAGARATLWRIGSHAYAEILRTPGVARIVGFWIVAFLAVTMSPLAAVFLLRGYHYSYAVAGAVTCAYAVGLTATSVFVGRLMDRVGQARVLLGSSLAFTAALGLLVALVADHAPVGVLCLAAAVSGGLAPRVSAALRSLWPVLLPERLRAGAHMLDATLAEVAPMAARGRRPGRRRR